MTADSQLLMTLDPAAVILFKTLHHFPATTKKTELVLTPMPSSRTVNLSGFSPWDDMITEEFAQNLSQDKFMTMEYIICPDEAHVAYGGIDPSLNLIEGATVKARLGG